MCAGQLRQSKWEQRRGPCSLAKRGWNTSNYSEENDDVPFSKKVFIKWYWELHLRKQ